MYQVSRIIISKKSNEPLYAYLTKLSQLAKNLHNAALFRMRQNFTAYNKEALSTNEQTVQNEIALLKKEYNVNIKQVFSYNQLEKLMRVTNNTDFFSYLPMQTAQYILKQTVMDFRSWVAALRAFKQRPEKFLGKPQMPKYKKGDLDTFVISNQDAVLYKEGDGTVLKLPKTKIRIPVKHLDALANLREVKVKPFYDSFEILITVEVEDIPANAGNNLCAIDLGVNNAASIVTNTGKSLIYKGGAIKAANQWFNKERARLVSIVTKGGNAYVDTAKLRNLSKHRTLFLRDIMHKMSCDIIRFCLDNQVGTIIIGEIKNWKQKSNIGHANNQAFVGIPFDMLKRDISYKAERMGIQVIFQDENNTSKADFLAGDECTKGSSFSGKRIKRGLYRSAVGSVINADLNAAANILKLAAPDAFDTVSDFSFLKKTTIRGFKDLYPSAV